ncbi:MAG TPA: hypothetical protein ENN58_02255, partial [bacterium]|nr:hypothetical protein [bacterium]
MFLSTPLAAENNWHEKNIIVTRLKNDNFVPYMNVFVSEDLSLSILVETVKRHVHQIYRENKISEIYFDASSGKGIHR